MLLNLMKDNKVLVIGIGLLCGLILSKVKKCKEDIVIVPNDKRLKESLKFLDADGFNPDSKSIVK